MMLLAKLQQKLSKTGKHRPQYQNVDKTDLHKYRVWLKNVKKKEHICTAAWVLNKGNF